MLHLADDALLGGFEETDDVVDLGALGHLVAYLVDGVEGACLPEEHEAVGVGDVLLYLVADAVGGHHGVVRTVVSHRLSTCDDVRGHVFREGGACLYHRAFAHACAGVLDDRR